MAVLFTSEEETDVVNAAKTALDLKIMKSTINLYEAQTIAEATETDENVTSVCGRSPFTSLFTAVLNRAKSLHFSSKTGGKNTFFCPELIDFLMNNYMSIFPLWSGVLLGDLSRFSEISTATVSQQSKTRESNCHVEQWFWIVKHSILKKKKYLRPADFIQNMYGSLQGRYKEHIINNNLLLPYRDPEPKEKFFSQKEEWAQKTSRKDKDRHKTKYFDPPEVLPQPSQSPEVTQISTNTIQMIPDTAMDLSKTKHKPEPEYNTEPDNTEHTAEDTTEEIQYLWSKNDCEVVVAVVPSAAKKARFTLHHSEFKTLQPHKWLMGEARIFMSY
ncbi:uncharacterized protein LOC113075953 [Carassius auratus]|uniref:Uncharacterized protein LOC113075953 n=1 Tax=Carassius auratus TaxID=7957 RepID=A0A6P6N828_CARAU|nr:uncharacterized protein LOC113075953 [Carassius auratus]